MNKLRNLLIQLRSVCDSIAAVFNFTLSNILHINLSLISSKCPMLNIKSAKHSKPEKRYKILPLKRLTNDITAVTNCVPKDTTNKSKGQGHRKVNYKTSTTSLANKMLDQIKDKM